jgi:hypothetical protein
MLVDVLILPLEAVSEEPTTAAADATCARLQLMSEL